LEALHLHQFDSPFHSQVTPSNYLKMDRASYLLNLLVSRERYVRHTGHTKTTRPSCLTGESLCHQLGPCVLSVHFIVADDSSSGQGGAICHETKRSTSSEVVLVSAGVSSGAVSEDNLAEIGEAGSWCSLHHPLSADTRRIRVLVRGDELGRRVRLQVVLVGKGGHCKSAVREDCDCDGHIYTILSVSIQDHRPAA
jgi:hypothetical protein